MISKPPIYQTISPPFDMIDAAVLRYPALKEIVHQYYADEYQQITDSPTLLDDLSTLPKVGKRLQRYLPAISLKIQEAATDDECKAWTDRYTNVSIQLFGRPNPAEAARLASADIESLRKMAQNSNIDASIVAPLFDAYTQLMRQYQDTLTSSIPSHTALLAKLHAYLIGRFNTVYAVLSDVSDSDIMTSSRIRKYYERMLECLSTSDVAWRDWRVVAHESAQMAVTSASKTIHVGRHLPPLPMRRVKSLFTHEVLVHAQRSVRGHNYDKKLAYGLPGYLAAEEGLGVLMEGAIEGKMPYRIRDRYIDITLALGYGDQPPLARQHLFVIVQARSRLRRLIENATINREVAACADWQHVNRIYRGTLGNEIVGVFTKDIIYYRGYQKMAHYLNKYSDENLKKAVDFVLSGKINPDDLAHRSYVHDRKFNIIRPNIV